MRLGLFIWTLAIVGVPAFADITRSPSEDGGRTCATAGGGCTIAVTCNPACLPGEVQTALDEAGRGDTITLEAGKTWLVYSPLVLYRKARGSGYLTVRSSASDNKLPAPDTRITPSYAGLMPTLALATKDARLMWVEQTTRAVEHYRFFGLQFTTAPGVETGDLIRFWDAINHTNVSYTPNDIVFDRCIFRGNPLSAVGKAIRFCVRSGVIRNSFFDHIKTQADSQAISMPNTPGPVLIENNYLAAAGENVLTGGVIPTVPNLVPQNITVQFNVMEKDPALFRIEPWVPGAWVRTGKIIKGGQVGNYIAVKSGQTGSVPPVFPVTHCPAPPACEGDCCVSDGEVVWQLNWFSSPEWVVKNVLEYKAVQGSRIAYNLFDGSWTHGQTGYGISFKPENQDPRNTWTARTEDIEFAHNLIRNVERPFAWLGRGDSGTGIARNWDIHDNLIYNLRVGESAILHGGADNVSFVHNTIDVPPQSNSLMALSGNAQRFVFRDNLARSGKYWVKRSAVTAGQASLAATFAEYEFRNNVVDGIEVKNFPPDNFNTPWARVGFFNGELGDFMLRDESPYKGKGSDSGTDIGADTSALPLIRGFGAVATDRAAVLYWYASPPVAHIPCVAEISTDRDFATSIPDLDPAVHPLSSSSEHDRNARDGMRRMILLGAGEPLTPDTKYWYRLHCAGDMEKGSFITGPARVGEETISISKVQDTLGAAQSSVEWGTAYSRAGNAISGGGIAGPVVCAAGAGCVLGVSAPAGRILYYRWIDKDAAGKIIQSSPVMLIAQGSAAALPDNTAPGAPATAHVLP